MNGKDLLGRAIKIEKARPRGSGKKGNVTRHKTTILFCLRICNLLNLDFSEERKEKPTGCTTIFLGKCPDEITDEEVKEIFKNCGKIRDIRWVTDKVTGQFKG